MITNDISKYEVKKRRKEEKEWEERIRNGMRG
jgi:hypothetical protein